VGVNGRDGEPVGRRDDEGGGLNAVTKIEPSVVSWGWGGRGEGCQVADRAGAEVGIKA